MTNYSELQAENDRLRDELNAYRARIAEFERRDTTPPYPPTSRAGYALLSVQVRELLLTVDNLSRAVADIVGRLDIVAADAATAARVATEIHRSYSEAKPVRDRVDCLESKVLRIEAKQREFSSRHCGDCILGGADDPGPQQEA